MGLITGDLLTSCGGSSVEPTAGRLRHVPAGAPAAGYFAAFLGTFDAAFAARRSAAPGSDSRYVAGGGVDNRVRP